MSTSQRLPPPSTTSSDPPTTSSSGSKQSWISLHGPSPVVPIHVAAQQQAIVTHKSHRLRTSPVPAEGSTYVPVVKFSQSFTQRNALRAATPVYETPPRNVQEEQEEIPMARPRVPGTDARTAGWTISITTSSSNHTSTPPDPTTGEEYQVEIHQHFEPPAPLPSTSHQQPLQGPVLGGYEPSVEEQPINRAIISRYVPTLGHDRVVLTEEDYARIRIRAMMLLVLGVLFPPIWVLMGWSAVLDSVILPRVFGSQREAVGQVYRPYRIIAAGLGTIVVLATTVGIVLGGLALGGVIV